MNAEEVANLCEALSLKENEGLLMSLHSGLKDGGSRRLSLRLAGKLLSVKHVNREAFLSVLPRIWRTVKEFEIEILEGNIFSFTFKEESDRRSVLRGGPWSFDKALLVLEEPTGKGDIREMKFDKVAFWIQIHKVPLLCMTSEIGRFLGSMIGEVKEIDDGGSGDCVGKYIRVRVVVDVTKPLRRMLRVDVLGDGKETNMLLRYERLPDHCYRCGRIGHVVRDCSIVPSSVEPEDYNLMFGSWLRA
ncbi:hypothetical protein EZV62_025894 [Acer yangbiense]|uniref:CCHC-type domain-containing protein n=1 Tax=Acer yangbiense TaxID=1000413 RepID=A0A5C7GZQ4_9ROSI|nr:hypothetical protein EZV62_025894 [Acer yangbiense]